MPSFNKVMLMGNLTRDPELKQTESGHDIAKFTLAVNRYVKTGNKQADFHDIVVWNKLADICSKYLHMGDAVFLEGRLVNSSFKTKSNHNVRKTEIFADTIKFINYLKSKEGDNVSLVEVVNQDEAD